MAIVHKHGKGTEVYVNGYDMTQILNSVDWDHTADTAETTTFGDNDMTYIAGLRQGSVNMSGLWSDAGGGAGSTDHLDGVFDDVLGSSTDVHVTVGYGGSTYTDSAMLAALQETQRAANSPMSGAVTTNVVGTVNGPTGLGKWVAPMVARSSNAVESTGTTVVMDGSTGLDGYMMHLHVVAGTTSSDVTAELTVTVQDSSDGITFADLPTQFAAVDSTAAATHSQRVLVSTAACYDQIHVQHVQDSTSLTWGVALARLSV